MSRLHIPRANHKRTDGSLSRPLVRPLRPWEQLMIEAALLRQHRIWDTMPDKPQGVADLERLLQDVSKGQLQLKIGA